MYKVNHYVLHGYIRRKDGHYMQKALCVRSLNDELIKSFHMCELEHFKVDHINVVYDYSETGF